MTPADITSLVGAITALFASIIIPLLLARRARQSDQLKKDAQERAAEKNTDVVSWTSLNQAIGRERDSLRERLESSEDEHERQMQAVKSEADANMRALRSSYDEKLLQANQRITELERQIDVLYRRLIQAEGGRPLSSREDL